MNELDQILLDQLHHSRNSKKRVRIMKKLLRNDPALLEGETYIDGRLRFFESMIEDHSILHKKRKRKRRNREIDILSKNPVYEWYKSLFIFTTLSLSLFFVSIEDYFRKDRHK